MLLNKEQGALPSGYSSMVIERFCCALLAVTEAESDIVLWPSCGLNVTEESKCFVYSLCASTKSSSGPRPDKPAFRVTLLTIHRGIPVHYLYMTSIDNTENQAKWIQF